MIKVSKSKYLNLISKEVRRITRILNDSQLFFKNQLFNKRSKKFSFKRPFDKDENIDYDQDSDEEY